MLGVYFWYILGGFFVLLILSFLGYFVLKPIAYANLNINEGWYLFGFIAVIFFGWYIGSYISIPVCLGINFGWLCSYSFRFITIVGLCIIFWKVTKLKKKEF